jgi:hypothetical protein
MVGANHRRLLTPGNGKGGSEAAASCSIILSCLVPSSPVEAGPVTSNGSEMGRRGAHRKGGARKGSAVCLSRHSGPPGARQAWGVAGATAPWPALHAASRASPPPPRPAHIGHNELPSLAPHVPRVRELRRPAATPMLGGSDAPPRLASVANQDLQRSKRSRMSGVSGIPVVLTFSSERQSLATSRLTSSGPIG